MDLVATSMGRHGPSNFLQGVERKAYVDHTGLLFRRFSAYWYGGRRRRICHGLPNIVSLGNYPFLTIAVIKLIHPGPSVSTR